MGDEVTALGHSPGCRCDTCGHGATLARKCSCDRCRAEATLAHIAQLEAELLDADA